MPRDPSAPSKIEVLVLSTIARAPMHGYDLLLELRYKHVRWWAKCEYSHVYAAIERLTRQGHLRPLRGPGAKQRPAGGRGRRVLAITAAGRRRLRGALVQVARSGDATFFDSDLFLSATYVLERDEAVSLLRERAAAMRALLDEARALQRRMRRMVPTVGRLIMGHRVDHLAREARFCDQAAQALAAEREWKPLLGNRTIGEFLAAAPVEIEPLRARP